MNKYQVEKLISYIILKNELVEHENKGVFLAIEGKYASADEIARACVFREEFSYMRDYDMEKNTINFNRIREKDKSEKRY